MKTINILQVKQAHTGHWFSSGAMKFFDSRIPQTAIMENGKAYFVSSERFDYNSPRLYSIRVCDMSSGKIDTIGEFQQYATSKQAYAGIKSFLRWTQLP